MKVFDIILQERDIQEAVNFLELFDFSDIETINENVSSYDCRYIGSHQYVDLYYNFVADYYFLVPKINSL